MGLKYIFMWIGVGGLTLFVLSFIFGFGDQENILKKFVVLIDSWAKWLERAVNSNRFKPRWYWWWHPEGHSWKIFLVTAIVMTFLVYGPTLELRHRGADASVFIGILIAALIVATLILKWLSWERFYPLLYCGLPGLAALILINFFPEVTERAPGIYLHILLPFIGILLIMIGIAWVILAPSFGLFRRYEQDLKDHLKPLKFNYGDLIDDTTLIDWKIDWKRAWRSLFLAPLYRPLEIILWPSFCVLVFTDRSWMASFALTAGVSAWAVYAAAEIHERLDHILGVLHRAFFIGGQFVVSVLVIGLAVGRIADVHYVTTMIEATPRFANRTILFYIAAFYLFFWFYEYWINRLLGEHLLKAFRASAFQGHLLKRTGKGCAKQNNNESTQKDYGTEQVEDLDEKVDSEVCKQDSKGSLGRMCYKYKKNEADCPEKCILQIHGGSRFALLDGNSDKILKTFGRMKLIDSIIDDSGDANALALKHRIRFYFKLLSLMLAGLLVLGGWLSYRLPQKAELSIPETGGEPSTFNLRSKLFAKNAAENAILLAASGGGSRAALYTHSILKGIWDIGAFKNVILVSGVSGGSAALAYFAAHYNDLLVDKESRAWSDFSKVFTEPFIQDVLESVTEWRMLVGNKTKERPVRENVRLGQLLKESFDQHFYPLPCDECPTTIGKQESVGLIFNTTLAGMFKRASRKKTSKYLSVLETEHKKARTSILRGGRLILTNLRTIDAFPPGLSVAGEDEYRLVEAIDEYLKYVVINDGDISLTVAAALSANFPPVFPNAAVDIDESVRYWVTDGGAMDNRGIISLLYALKGAVKKEFEKYGHIKPLDRRRPIIHIIVADASAVDYLYSQDRGIGAAFGAPARLASQLMVSLIKDIKDVYACMDGTIELHYLNMPLVLRSNGGLGTHWMFPSNVTLRTPYGIKGDDKVPLEGDIVKKIVEDLHRSNPKNLVDGNEKLTNAWTWICQDDIAGHREAWVRLAKALGHEDEYYKCPQ